MLMLLFRDALPINDISRRISAVILNQWKNQYGGKMQLKLLYFFR